MNSDEDEVADDIITSNTVTTDDLDIESKVTNVPMY